MAKVTCWHCGGKGYLVCYHCNGTKIEYRYDEEEEREIPEECPRCDGTGYIDCNYCRGTGEVED